MGSRFGGPKQLAPVGPAGETILEYNAHDATAAGFGGVVIVTREDLMTMLEDRISNMSPRVQTHVVFQQVPEARAKPLGTAEAVIAAAGHISGPFGVANADDIYGPDAFRSLVRHFEARGRTEAAVIGYRLWDTLPAKGAVSRAVLTLSGDHVQDIVEVQGLSFDAAGSVVSAVERARVLAGQEIVSMNLWGLPDRVMRALRSAVETFARTAPVDAEISLAAAIDQLLRRRHLIMRVLEASEPWIGMTNPSDLEAVREYIRRNRPEPLWT